MLMQIFLLPEHELISDDGDVYHAPQKGACVLHKTRHSTASLNKDMPSFIPFRYTSQILVQTLFNNQKDESQLTTEL